MRKSFAAISIAAAQMLACGLPIFAKGLGPVPGTPLDRREVVDALGRTVTYYIGHPRNPRAPILLMIQGSGCIPVIVEQGSNSFSTFFGLLPYAGEGDFTVVAVEKPYSGAGDRRDGGTAKSCGEAFNADFTAERWLAALRAALEDARKSPWVDARRTLVFGVSEGAVMADMLAGRDSSITDVIAIGGPGTTQLFSFVVLAYQHCFNSSECLADLERNLRDIRSDPESATRFAWGHPYKRWTSFFQVDPGEELLRSKARIYMAFGTADASTPALSEEIAIAKLQLAGRDLTVRRVPDAGHSLSNDLHPDWHAVESEYRAALDWFWQRRD